MASDDGARVAAAIRAAEAITDGEVSAIVAPASDSYRDVVLHWAMPIALLPAAIAAAWPQLLAAAASWLTPWEAPSIRLMLTLLLVGTIVAFLIARPLLGIAGIRHVLVPHATKTRRVRRRALMLFRTGTEARTASSTGVLLYLSMAERRAEIVADAAIHARVSPDVWGEAMAVLVDAMHDDRPGDGMVAAIERIGQVLAAHFPYTGTDPNELPDRLIEL